MVAQFVSSEQRSMYDAVLSGLRGLGYGGDLLREDYQYEDWFASRLGQTPQIAHGRCRRLWPFPLVV